MPVGALDTKPEPEPAKDTDSVSGGMVLKVAVTLSAVLIVTTQEPTPEQPAPDQPANSEPGNGVAVKVTAVP